MLLRLAPLAAAAALLAGCAGGEAPVRAQGGVLPMTLDEYRLDPQVARARRGRLTLDLRSVGRLHHNLVFERGGKEVLRIKSLRPGERRRVTVDVKAGGYRLLCSLSNHEELGMNGTLTVSP